MPLATRTGEGHLHCAHYTSVVDILTLTLTIGATARLTRLVTTDRITETPREWILDRLNPNGMWAYLIKCPWCIGLWLAAVVSISAWAAHHQPWWTITATALTASHATGLLARSESDS